MSGYWPGLEQAGIERHTGHHRCAQCGELTDEDVCCGQEVW